MRYRTSIRPSLVVLAASDADDGGEQSQQQNNNEDETIIDTTTTSSSQASPNNEPKLSINGEKINGASAAPTTKLDDGNDKATIGASTPSKTIPSTTSKAITSSRKTFTTSNSSQEKQQPSPLQDTIDRMSKPRSYPLFLAEKAAEFFESTLEDVVSTAIIPDTLPYYSGASSSSKKEKIVVLGSGWGAAPFLQKVDTTKYDVTVISPRDYFLFTPMLAGASVGTVEFKSITEPVRELNPDARFIEAMATKIDPTKKIVHCSKSTTNNNNSSFEISYDKLIMSIGAKSNTFQIPGVKEYCLFLRQVEDARQIRTSIQKCFEKAAAKDDRKRKEQLLSFVIIGGGPTGVEFSSELNDFIQQDASKKYPDLMKYVSIQIVEASSNILSMFDKPLQEEAIQQLTKGSSSNSSRRKTEVLLNSSVKQVTKDTVILGDGVDDTTEIPYGLAIWAAGNGPLPLTLQLIDSLGDAQTRMQQGAARGRLAVDPWMRVLGTNDGSIVAIGDCSYFAAGGEEQKSPLPATAQVASQQGEYLAKLLNKGYDWSPELTQDGILPPPAKQKNEGEEFNDIMDRIPRMSDWIASIATETTTDANEYAKPFQFLNLGLLTYTGDGTALSQISLADPSSAAAASDIVENIRITGSVGNGIWRSVYWAKQVSWRSRLLLLNDWSRKPVSGRDVSRL